MNLFTMLYELVFSVEIGVFRPKKTIFHRWTFEFCGAGVEKRDFQNGGRRRWAKLLTSAILGLETRIIAQKKAIDAYNTNPM